MKFICNNTWDLTIECLFKINGHALSLVLEVLGLEIMYASREKW